MTLNGQRYKIPDAKAAIEEKMAEREIAAQINEIGLLPNLEIIVAEDGNHVRASLRRFAENVLEYKEKRMATLQATQKAKEV